MKPREFLTALVAIMLLAGGAVYGQAESREGSGYMGIRMDTALLPRLLTKHLRLDEGQGVRIQNIGKGTAADKAGLERDDIIIGFEDEDVTGREGLAKAVQKAGTGAEVSLRIIHLGKRKTITLKLGTFTDDFEAKYPLEPELLQSWQPGRMFRLEPDADKWMEVWPGNDGKNIRIRSGDGRSTVVIDQWNLVGEIYTYSYFADGESYTVTIQGDPDDEDAKIIVRIGDEQHETTAKEIDKLPKKYRVAAEQSLETARHTSEVRKFQKSIKPFQSTPGTLDTHPWSELLKNRRWQDLFQPPRTDPEGDMHDRIQEQMRQLQKRIEELENRSGKESDVSAEDNGADAEDADAEDKEEEEGEREKT